MADTHEDADFALETLCGSFIEVSALFDYFDSIHGVCLFVPCLGHCGKVSFPEFWSSLELAIERLQPKYDVTRLILD